MFLMYEAVTGKLPMSYEDTGGDKEEFSMQVYVGLLKPDFEELDRKASPELARIIKKCMARMPVNRYDSMQQVQEELESLIPSHT